MEYKHCTLGFSYTVNELFLSVQNFQRIGKYVLLNRVSRVRSGRLFLIAYPSTAHMHTHMYRSICIIFFHAQAPRRQLQLLEGLGGVQLCFTQNTISKRTRVTQRNKLQCYFLFAQWLMVITICQAALFFILVPVQLFLNRLNPPPLYMRRLTGIH